MIDYIWTYWTKPHAGATNFFDLACLGLSVALAGKHGTAKLVYTDSEGARQIDRFKIGAPSLVSLESLKNENPQKWALPKIDTYSKIDFSGTHIDYDVFLWKEQSKSCADFCCQSLEAEGSFIEVYKTTFHDFLNDAGYCPVEISDFSSKEIYAGYNMGYLQINNWEFINEYAEVARNIFGGMKTFHRHNNIFPEQYLFYCMAKKKDLQVDILFNNLLSWDEQCVQSGYTHLMGEKRENKNMLFRRILKKLEVENHECHRAIVKEIDWSMFEVGKSLVRTAKNFAAGGGKLVDEETYQARVSLCTSCEHYDPTGYNNTGKCAICKCSTVAKPKLAVSSCPVGKWKAV
jgi:hypothetical protein